MDDPLSDNTLTLMAAEAAYFNRGAWHARGSRGRAAGSLCPRGPATADQTSRQPVEFIPTLEEIAAESASGYGRP